MAMEEFSATFSAESQPTIPWPVMAFMSREDVYKNDYQYLLRLVSECLPDQFTGKTVSEMYILLQKFQFCNVSHCARAHLESRQFSESVR